MAIESLGDGEQLAAAGTRARINHVHALRVVFGYWRILDAEVEDRAASWSSVRERRDGRIIGIEQQCRGGRQPRQRIAPALGNGIYLAIAVQLVAKEVGDENCARLEL